MLRPGQGGGPFDKLGTGREDLEAEGREGALCTPCPQGRSSIASPFIKIASFRRGDPPGAVVMTGKIGADQIRINRLYLHLTVARYARNTRQDH